MTLLHFYNSAWKVRWNMVIHFEGRFNFQSNSRWFVYVPSVLILLLLLWGQINIHNFSGILIFFIYFVCMLKLLCFTISGWTNYHESCWHQQSEENYTGTGRQKSLCYLWWCGWWVRYFYCVWPLGLSCLSLVDFCYCHVILLSLFPHLCGMWL